MNKMEAMEKRHAVRDYLDKPIPGETITALEAKIEECNAKGGLHIQLVTGEPDAFDGFMAHYGKFKGVQNYVALIGSKGPVLDERIGYYGEIIALEAQILGLNTCWVAMSFSKGSARKRCQLDAGEKLVCVLALGYGATQGVPHPSKPMASLIRGGDSGPAWFRKGVEAAMLAPTAMNQQKFEFSLLGDKASVRSLGGFYASIDLGIVMVHFEMGSGRKLAGWS